MLCVQGLGNTPAQVLLVRVLETGGDAMTTSSPPPLSQHPGNCFCIVRRASPKTWTCNLHGWYAAGSYYGWPCPCIKAAIEEE